MSIRVLIVEDHNLMRQGLVSLLKKEDDIEVIGEAENGQIAVELAESLQPDLIVMDMGLPELNGFDATQIILEKQPDIEILGISMHTEYRFVMRALKAGVRGYLSKNCAYSDLCLAIRVVMDGQMYLSPGVTKVVIENALSRMPDEEVAPISLLNDRERRVLQYVAEGKASKQIARLLYISENTVTKYRQNIMKKLGLTNIADLTKFALREGITTID